LSQELVRAKHRESNQAAKKQRGQVLETNTRLSELKTEPTGGRQFQQQTVDRGLQRTGQRTSACVAVSAAAERLRDAGDIELALAANAQAEAAIGQFAEEERGIDAFNADEIAYDAFAVFGARVSCSDR
jgi:hypothetical protein